MELKKLIGTGSYWTINKSIAKLIGLEATLVLQHLIDLEENYFKGEFWQKSTSIQESTGLSKYKVKSALTVLINEELLIVENKVPKGSSGISKSYHFTLLKSNIGKLFNLCELKNLTDTSKEILPTQVKKFNRVDKEKENKENNKINIDVSSEDDIKGKMFFKLVDMYPKNRIGNRQHGLKKFKQLDIEQGKLVLKNLNRYLNISNGFVKSLQNYIVEECYSEEWLQAEELNKTQKQNINKNNNTKNNAKSFTDRNSGFYD